MTDKPQEGPARVEQQGPSGFYYLNVYDLKVDRFVHYRDAERFAKQFNEALAPLLRKAELADRMAEELEFANRAIDPQIADINLKLNIRKVLADYRKITEGKP